MEAVRVRPPCRVQNLTSMENKITFISEMVFIEGGNFLIGNDIDNTSFPVRNVTVKDFYLGKYPVTQALWEAIMGNNPSHFKRNEMLPVESVSWDDAQAFITKLNEKTGLNYRLPSETEWEYAARGGKYHATGFMYAGSNNLDEVGWYNGNSGGETKLVGLKRPNQLGLYDMSGNVWEWCEDDWHESYTDSIMPTGSLAWIDHPRSIFRVMRGGSWHYDPEGCRSAYRGGGWAFGRSCVLGFRLATSF